jgi:hypothetical protein
VSDSRRRPEVAAPCDALAFSNSAACALRPIAPQTGDTDAGPRRRATAGAATSTADSSTCSASPSTATRLSASCRAAWCRGTPSCLPGSRYRLGSVVRPTRQRLLCARRLDGGFVRRLDDEHRARGEDDRRDGHQGGARSIPGPEWPPSDGAGPSSSRWPSSATTRGGPPRWSSRCRRSWRAGSEVTRRRGSSPSAVTANSRPPRAASIHRTSVTQRSHADTPTVELGLMRRRMETLVSPRPYASSAKAMAPAPYHRPRASPRGPTVRMALHARHR